jgi:hypothetical protein
MTLKSQINFHAAKLRSLRKQARKEAAGRLGHAKRHGVGSRDRDEELKAKRGYTDPSTYVRRDGSEKLVGEDWKKRVLELRQRSGGICEARTIYQDDNYRCQAPATDPHHVIRRSVRRDDRLSNLRHLCRFHHDDLDQRKPRWAKRGTAAERREQA